MFILKQLWQIWRSGELKSVLSMFKHSKKKFQEETEIIAKMQSLELWPAINIGSAIREANHYGIEFDVGTTHYDCRAILPRSKWQRDINRNVSLETLAFFTVPRSYDEIEAFQGISDRIEIAICRCLIQARIAGVI